MSATNLRSLFFPTRPPFLALMGVAACFLFFYPTFLHIFETWGQEEYSHGYLILPLVLLLLLHKIQGVKPSSRGTGLAVPALLLCFAAQFLFVIGNVRGLQPQVLWVFVVSLFLLIYGWKVTRAGIPAFVFLLFALPLPRGLYYALSLKMQGASTSLGVFLLEMLGVSVFQEGNIIDLGAQKLQVVEACNGVRYLFPLMASGFLLSLAYKSSMFKRVFLFLSTIPITILMNGLRLALIGVTVNAWGPEMAEGLIHDFEGWVVFIGCLALLLAEVALLSRIGTPGTLGFDFLSLPKWKNLPAPPVKKISKSVIGLMIVAVFVGAFLFVEGSAYVRSVPLKQSLSAFPLHIGSWRGKPGQIDTESLAVLGTDDYTIIDYKNEAGAAVNLYILYYPKQDGTSNQVVHTPSGCMPAGGWVLGKQSLATLALAFNGEKKPLRLNRLTVNKENEEKLVYYWYVQDGVELTNGTLSRLAIIGNALSKRRANGAMVRLVTEIKNGDERAAEETLQLFLETGGLAEIEKGILPQ